MSVCELYVWGVVKCPAPKHLRERGIFGDGLNGGTLAFAQRRLGNSAPVSDAATGYA